MNKNIYKKRNLFIYPIICSSLIILNYFSPAKTRENDINSDYFERIYDTEYILGEGDLISIRLHDNDNKELYKIDGNGTIDLINLNRIYVKGLTLKELTKLLNDKYSDFMFEPNISISIIEYRSVDFFVSGEVNDPGRHSLSNNLLLNRKETDKKETDNKTKNTTGILKESNSERITSNNYFPTLYDAIREAGGITRYSDLSKITIIRKNSISKGGGYKKANIDFLGVINAKELSNNIRILDEDIIKIPKSNVEFLGQINKAILSNLNEKFIEVYVSGRSEYNGIVKVSKLAALSDAIEISGGLKAIRGNITFHRFGSDGSIERRVIRNIGKRGTLDNPYLQSGDLIYVGKNPLNVANELFSEIFGPFTAPILQYGLLTR